MDVLNLDRVVFIKIMASIYIALRSSKLTSLLYACETWTVYQHHARKLNRFHLNCLRKILRITWQVKVLDTEVLAQAELPSIQIMFHRAQLQWAGHVV